MQRGTHRAAGRRRSGAPLAPWFTRVRAVLAGCLVLGVGATLTLAAWTDREHASASFETSTFHIEGSSDGSTFASHPSESPASLAFTPSALALSPGSTVYAKYVIRKGTTDAPGTVQLGGGVTAGDADLASALRYGVKTLSGTNPVCNESTYAASGAIVVAANSALTTASATNQGLQDGGGSRVEVTYCFAITLPSPQNDTLQGKSATATWVFTGTSSS